MSVEAASRNVDPEVESLVKETGIPPCPRIIVDFMEEMRADDPDFRKISGLVSADVALSAAMLKTVNSPFYGLRTKATTVQQACTILGLRSMAFMISGLLLRRAFPVDKSKSLDLLWRIAAGVASFSGALAKKFSGVDRDTAYTYGLFRDCGMAVLLPKYADYAGVIDGSARQEGAPITLLENTRYDMNHARVGAALANSWQLPEALCEAIQHHHNYEGVAAGKLHVNKRAVRLIAIGALAEQLYALQSTQAPSHEWPLAQSLVEAELGVRSDNLASLLEMIRDEASAAG